jgi:hypothetical protein
LAGCTAPYGIPPFGGPAAAPPTGSLQSARQACNTTYPPHIGNYLPHAQCVNAAVESYAMPSERYPDLVRLQEQARTVVSQQIDDRTISVRAGENKMSAADKLIAEARRERDVGHAAAADRNVERLQAMLQQ